MRRAPQGPTVCPKCHGIFAKKRWHFDPAQYAKLEGASTTGTLLCPACRKIRDGYPEGVVTLKWPGLKAHDGEIMGLIKHVEARALTVNPLERVMKVVKRRDAVEIQTTNDKLAQRIGRELVRAYKGDVTYHWSHKDKLTRVDWNGPTRPEGKPRTAG